MNLQSYATFRGRASRPEYWWALLANLIIYFALFWVQIILIFVAPSGIVASLSYLYSLAFLVPGLAVGVRRLHDTGRSGWWLLIGLIPAIGWIVLIVLFTVEGQPNSNRYGDVPARL
ncbi:MAG: DUF805 domain-containing protein [Acidobacteria bacterium]|nr:DUF805 domain-containing protein [Acidobacteriota bacterium]